MSSNFTIFPSIHTEYKIQSNSKENWYLVEDEDGNFYISSSSVFNKDADFLIPCPTPNKFHALDIVNRHNVMVNK